MLKLKRNTLLKINSQTKNSAVKLKAKQIVLSLFKVFSVFILGILLTWIFLELALFVFGKTQRLIQLSRNIVSNNDEFVILCLGESTTAPTLMSGDMDSSWPSRLNFLLKEANLGRKIKVVNEGIVGINSVAILDNLERNLEKYHPDLVISMMGTNDTETMPYEQAAGIKGNSFQSKSRVYRLIKFLIANIKDKYEQTKNKTTEEKTCYSERRCIDLAESQNLSVIYEKNLAIKYYNKALEYNPMSADALAGLACVYSFLEVDVTKILDYSRRALEINPRSMEAYWVLTKIAPKLPYHLKIVEEIEKDIKRYKVDNGWLFIALANYYEYEGNKDRLVYLEKALKLMPNQPYVKLQMARYYRQKGDLKKSEKFYLQALQWGKNSVALIEAAQLYSDMGEESLADSYWQKTFDPEIKDNKYNRNYSQLHQKLKDKNIAFMAVQYPMRSIKPLQLTFQDKPDVLIVDNEQSFKSLVKEKGYDKVFVDAFAGDFGHCTELGNQLLAENVKSAILKNWDIITNKN